MKLFLALILWVLAEAISVVGPAYPPDAIEGGTVVAVLQVAGGAVRDIDLLQADAPFAASVRSALAAWHFPDSESGRILVTVNFRTPKLYPTGSPARSLDQTRNQPGLPYPRRIVEPSYGADAVAEGSVILRLTINEAGEIMRTKTLQGLGSLTASSVAAIKKWQFAPARDAKGIPKRSEAYAVCVFRRPVL